MADRSGGEPPRAPTRATWQDDVLVLWLYSDEAKLEGFAVCPSPIDDYHLQRCNAAGRIAKQVGVSYSDVMRILVPLWPEG